MTLRARSLCLMATAAPAKRHHARGQRRARARRGALDASTVLSFKGFSLFWVAGPAPSPSQSRSGTGSPPSPTPGRRASPRARSRTTWARVCPNISIGRVHDNKTDQRQRPGRNQQQRRDRGIEGRLDARGKPWASKPGAKPRQRLEPALLLPKHLAGKARVHERCGFLPAARRRVARGGVRVGEDAPVLREGRFGPPSSCRGLKACS